jgi:glycosyltransferase involved in cell wall biosynthesis
MRVLHVIQELATGGAEHAVLTLAAGAQAAGWDVRVAAAPGALSAELGRTPYPLPLLRRSPWRVPQGAAALASAMRDCRPGLVHAHNPGMALMTGVATLRGRSTPALASLHGVPDEDYPAAVRVLRLAGLPVVTCGPGVTAALAEHGLVAAATIVNAVSPAPEPAHRAALEQEWGIPAGAPFAVSVGRLVHQKNHALAVSALASIPELRLAILGEGELRAELERQAGALGVRERLVMPGVRRDARAVVGAADMALLPSRWEGLPLVALEALAAGTPIVATAVRGIRELLTDSENALLVPPGDPEALASAIRRLLADRSLAEALAGNGRRLSEQYGEGQMVASFLELYGTLGGR